MAILRFLIQLSAYSSCSIICFSHVYTLKYLEFQYRSLRILPAEISVASTLAASQCLLHPIILSFPCYVESSDPLGMHLAFSGERTYM